MLSRTYRELGFQAVASFDTRDEATTKMKTLYSTHRVKNGRAQTLVVRTDEIESMQDALSVMIQL